MFYDLSPPCEPSPYTSYFEFQIASDLSLMAVLQRLEAVDHERRPPRLAHAELARTRDDPHVRCDRREAPEVLSPHTLRMGVCDFSGVEPSHTAQVLHQSCSEGDETEENQRHLRPTSVRPGY